MKKHVFCIALVLCMMFALLTLAVSAGDTGSGTCGTGLTWVLDSTGTLTISGSGSMDNYGYNDVSGASNAPWWDLRNSITKVVIGEGVTRVGDAAFYNLDKLKEAVIGIGVTEIGPRSFRSCNSLKTVTIPGDGLLNYIGNEAFLDDSALASITLPSSLTGIGEKAFA